jgi:hypothetical protein
MSRNLHRVLAFAVLMAGLSCNGSDGSVTGSESVSSAGNCPAGQTAQGTQCIAATSCFSGGSAAPDLQAGDADVVPDVGACPASPGFAVRVWNRGAVEVSAGVPIALYESRLGGALLAVGRTAAIIEPGGSTTATIVLPPAPAGPVDVAVVVNDDGTGQGVVGECDKTNNTVVVPGFSCPPVPRHCPWPGRPCSGRW